MQATQSLDESLPYRSVKQLLSGRPVAVYSAAPADTALAALKSMAEHRTGFLVVLQGEQLVGVISERDYSRKMVMTGRTAQDTLVSDIMTREVVTATPAHRFGEVIQLMNTHGIRHLPVVEGGRVVAVLSVRDLLREAVAHHEKVIRAMEMERMTIFNSAA